MIIIIALKNYIISQKVNLSICYFFVGIPEKDSVLRPKADLDIDISKASRIAG